MAAESLRMVGICKSFGPVQALKDVSFTARAGTVHALCGENGAGKSTLMKTLAGALQPDAGQIFVEGSEKVFAGPLDALKAGISMLYQELDLAPHLTVAENVFLGRERRKARFPLLLDQSGMVEETQALIRECGFEIDANALVADLPQSKRQLVELLKAIHREARIIVMDEPTSSLSEGEAERLLQIVGELRQRGLTIIYISHRLEEVQRLADDVSVLRDGSVVGTGPISEYSPERIIQEMVGRALADYFPPRSVVVGETFFEACGLSSAEGISDVSFSVRRGEIVGMAGLIGAGRTETARAIFGACPATAGEIRLGGKTVRVRRPSDAIARGIAYLTEDRKGSGLCVELPCHWNVTLPNYERLGMKAFVDSSREYAEARRWGEQVRAKWSAPDAPASSLSGGNQQKVLLARWLQANADFLIFDEPTRGIDVGAKREIYGLLNELAGQGKAILVISSELPELFGLCDRILVMRGGRLVGESPTAETTPENIMRLATQAL